MFTSLLKNAEAFFSQINFGFLVYVVWGSFAALFVITLAANILFSKIRAAKKNSFLCLVNAYSGVNLALFITEYDISPSIFVTAVFWVAGYLLYGLLCMISKPAKQTSTRTPAAVVQPVLQPAAAAAKQPALDIPAARNNVRLDHALSITDKLLTKNLGKSDRQELERLKNTLSVMQIKGILTPAEMDVLNDNFNALLKLMAKYNV